MFGLGAIGTIRAFESDMNKLCLLAMVFSLTAFSQANESVVRDIQAKYDAIATICTIDIKQAIPRTEKLLTSDYTWVDSMGAEFSREPYLSSQSRVVANVSKVFAAKNELLSYKMDGIYFRCRIKSSLMFRGVGFSKDKHLGVSISDDVWVKTIHGWKMFKSTSIREYDTIV